jgi:hypothetical protein
MFGVILDNVLQNRLIAQAQRSNIRVKSRNIADICSIDQAKRASNAGKSSIDRGSSTIAIFRQIILISILAVANIHNAIASRSRFSTICKSLRAEPLGFLLPISHFWIVDTLIFK